MSSSIENKKPAKIFDSAKMGRYHESERYKKMIEERYQEVKENKIKLDQQS